MTRDEILAKVEPELHGVVNEALDAIWKINPDILVVDCKVINKRIRLYLGLMPIKDFNKVYDVVRNAENESLKILDVIGYE